MRMMSISFVLLTALLSGCITSSRMSYSFDDKSIGNGDFRLKRKYHIVEMNGEYRLGDDADNTINQNKTRFEIEGYESCLPEVFDRNGIPIRIIYTTVYRKKDNNLWLLPYHIISAYATAFIFPTSGGGTDYELEHQLRVIPSNMIRTGEITIHSNVYGWFSTIGLGALMPFPDPPDERFSVDCSWSMFLDSKDSRAENLGNKAIAYGIAAALQRLEALEPVPRMDGPVRIGN